MRERSSSRRIASSVDVEIARAVRKRAADLDMSVARYLRRLVLRDLKEAGLLERKEEHNDGEDS